MENSPEQHQTFDIYGIVLRNKNQGFAEKQKRKNSHKQTNFYIYNLKKNMNSDQHKIIIK
jgi:hypothetical protein